MEPDDIPGAPTLGKQKKQIELKEEPATEQVTVERQPQLIRSAPMVQPRAEEEPVAEDSEDTWQEPDKLNEHVEEPGDPDGVYAEETKQRWLEKQRHEPVAEPPKRKKRRARWPIAVLLLLVIAAVLGVTYKYAVQPALKPQSKQQATNQKQPTTTNNNTASKPESIATVKTKDYTSENLMISFAYPETWKITDTADKVTIVSPSTQLTQTDGKKIAAHVIVTMSKPQTTIAGYPAGGATAIDASERLSYKQPTTIQRAQTYLSKLSYANQTGLNALFVTGDNGYQQGQAVPLADVIKGDPLISVTFATCATDDCATPTAITVSATAWKVAVENTLATNIVTSLQLQ